MLAKISKIKGLRLHGFLKRMANMKKGSNVINDRRQRGRKLLAPASVKRKKR